MSDANTRIDQLEQQMLVDRNATNVLLNKVDRIEVDIKKMDGRLDRIEDILQLVLQSVNEIKTQLRPKNTEE